MDRKQGKRITFENVNKDISNKNKNNFNANKKKKKKEKL